jgi:paraquat-inducible protein B
LQAKVKYGVPIAKSWSELADVIKQHPKILVYDLQVTKYEPYFNLFKMDKIDWENKKIYDEDGREAEFDYTPARLWLLPLVAAIIGTIG